MTQPIPDRFWDAVDAGDIPETYDVDAWRAEQDWDDQLNAADMTRKARAEGAL